MPLSPRVLLERVTNELKRASDGAVFYSVDVMGRVVFDWEAGDIGYFEVNGKRASEWIPLDGSKSLPFELSDGVERCRV